MVDPGLLTLALLAGAVAAFNPCGFALLPAYLTVLVIPPHGAGRRKGLRRADAVLRAVRFGAGMTTGFLLVFGIAAAVVVPLTISLGSLLPVVTMLIGAVLILLGVRVLRGRSLALPGLPVPRKAPTAGWISQVGYGVTFALASLSCTLAPFLAATTSALGAGTAVGVIAAFAAYAAGMGTVVTVLAIAAAATATSAAGRSGRAAEAVTRLAGVLLLLAGAYVSWYGWFELRVLDDPMTQDPIVEAATQAQSAVVSAVTGFGAPGVAVAAGFLLVIAAAVLRHQRDRRRDATGSSPAPGALSPWRKR